MAYAIFADDNILTRIAANDTDLSNLIIPNGFTTKTISDADYNGINAGTKTATFDGTTVTVSDLADADWDQETLQASIDGMIAKYEAVLDQDNSTKDNALVSGNNCSSILTNLKALDISGETYPYACKTLEDYLNDNSFTFVNVLRLP